MNEQEREDFFYGTDNFFMVKCPFCNKAVAKRWIGDGGYMSLHVECWLHMKEMAAKYENLL